MGECIFKWYTKNSILTMCTEKSDFVRMGHNFFIELSQIWRPVCLFFFSTRFYLSIEQSLMWKLWNFLNCLHFLAPITLILCLCVQPYVSSLWFRKRKSNPASTCRLEWLDHWNACYRVMLNIQELLCLSLPPSYICDSVIFDSMQLAIIPHPRHPLIDLPLRCKLLYIRLGLIELWKWHASHLACLVVLYDFDLYPMRQFHSVVFCINYCILFISGNDSFKVMN